MSSDDHKRAYHQERGETPPPPSGCPVHQTWSPLNDDYLADPYEIAIQLQADHPTFYSQQLNYLVVTEMDEIPASTRNGGTSSGWSDGAWPQIPISSPASRKVRIDCRIIV